MNWLPEFKSSGNDSSTYLSFYLREVTYVFWASVSLSYVKGRNFYFKLSSEIESIYQEHPTHSRCSIKCLALHYILFYLSSSFPCVLVSWGFALPLFNAVSPVLRTVPDIWKLLQKTTDINQCQISLSQNPYGCEAWL